VRWVALLKNWSVAAANQSSSFGNSSARFLAAGPSPAAALEFERQLQGLLHELGRRTAEIAYNAIEPAEAQQAPHYVQHEGTIYRRLNAPTANRHVATLFGKVTLQRRGYRDAQRSSPEPTLFPLELALGLVEGATPALAYEAAQALAEGGATQQTVLDRLRRQFGVEWGVKKLRALSEQISIELTPLRREQQAQRVVEWLRQAQEQRGSGRPVLAVGRDGITLCTRPHRFCEVATTATLTVYDRRGQRLGTVYLAYVPELGQETMSDELTALVNEVLRQWDGPLPRLTYVTDAGDSEVKYFRQRLRKMRHPVTGVRLDWQWVVDFYHASERLHTMAVALFGEGREAFAWARRMAKLLKKPNGPFRVLHAAAAAKAQRKMSKRATKDFRRAYNYLRVRTRHMQYARFKKLGLPIGSGVTEAACKTVFTQRLKLSGMTWTKSGAQTILDLRVILLSGLWDKVYATALAQRISPIAVPPACLSFTGHEKPRTKCA
jgi:hypothetical protein